MVNYSYSYREIENMANQFLDVINPKRQFPITDDMWKIAEEYYDIEIRKQSREGGFLGSMIYDLRNQNENVVQKKFNKKAIVLVNENLSPKLRLLLIAHEIGHYFILKEVKPFGYVEDNVNDNLVFCRPKDAENKLANLFASCVLMPINEFLNSIDSKRLFVRNESLVLEDVKIIQNRFGVTRNAVTARAEDVIKYHNIEIETVRNY